MFPGFFPEVLSEMAQNKTGIILGRIPERNSKEISENCMEESIKNLLMIQDTGEPLAGNYRSNS